MICNKKKEELCKKIFFNFLNFLTALVLRRVSFAVQLGVARNVILCRAVHDV